MKILFITSSSINGGAQKHIKETFRSLAELGHTVYLIAPEGWLIDELSNYGERIIKASRGRAMITEIRKVLDNIEPDITNTFILSGGVYGALAWKKKKYGKLFITVNNPVIYPGISFAGKVMYPQMYRWMSKYATAFLVKSDKVRDEVSKVIKKKLPVVSIKNGVDFKVFDSEKLYPDIRKELGIKKDDIVVTNVAVLEERKGQQYLIDALVELHQQYPVHLFLVGEGSDEVRLQALVKDKGAESFVHFLGRRSDINTILANSDIFVLSSLHEGLPNALLEAMAMGLPCISTDVGGTRQLIDSTNVGIVVNPKSSLEIKNAIISYIKDFDSAKLVGKNACARIKNDFSQDKVVSELISIYGLERNDKNKK